MFARVRSLLLALTRRSAFERDMDDELRFHLEQRAEDLVKTGLTREAAVRRARIEFGNPEACQDRCRESRQLRPIDDVRLDCRFAWRTIRKNAFLSATVVATLALAIGATTAIFSVVNGVILQPLPYPDPGRLVMIGSVDNDGRPATVFAPDFVEWRAQCRSCEHVAAYGGSWPTNLTGGIEPERVRIARVTRELFATMGVQPVLGRTFLPEETGRPLFGRFGEEQNAVTAVVLSHGLWQRRFGKDPSVVGRKVSVEGDASTIVGVMPEGFSFPGDAEAWVPADLRERRDNAYLRVIARLRPEATPAQALTELQLINHRIYRTAPDGREEPTIGVRPLHDYVVGDIRPSLFVFLGAVGFVLLIACANVANLLLAQAATRPKELAVRAALGASRRRIVRQLLTESLVLSTLGGALGLVLGFWLLKTLVALAPSDIPRIDAIGIDRWVLGFTLLLSLTTGVLFGLAPMVRASSPDLISALQEGGARVSGSVERNRLRKILVVGEVSLAMILLIGAGLLIKSFVELRQTPIGFDPGKTLTATVTVPHSTYPTAARARAYFQAALERIAGLPDVRAVGIVNALPLGRDGARINGDFRVDGEPKERRGSWGRKLAVGGDYFRAVGIPILKGRPFDERDTEEAPCVMVVTESVARRVWSDDDPLGHRITIGFSKEPWCEVVGVAGDAKYDDVGERQAPGLYLPYRQVSDKGRWFLAEMSFVVRTGGAPEDVAAGLRSALAQVDKDLPLYSVASMNDVIAARVTDPQFYTLLLASFSVIALVLAAAGIYGLISYSITQRTHEIGVRIALGARSSDVLRMIIGEGMLLAAVGAAIGLGGAFAFTRLLTRFLYQVSVTDQRTFLSLPLLLCGVALLACYLPARKAMRVDPTIALRRE
jgi:putative ABC transport system permease protein